MERNHGLGAPIWCGIAAVALGAAALLVESRIGAAVLIVGFAWLGGACYLDYRKARQR